MPNEYGTILFGLVFFKNPVQIITGSKTKLFKAYSEIQAIAKRVLCSLCQIPLPYSHYLLFYEVRNHTLFFPPIIILNMVAVLVLKRNSTGTSNIFCPYRFIMNEFFLGDKMVTGFLLLLSS